MTKIRPDLKRFDDLLDMISAREKGHILDVVPLPNRTVLSEGYSEDEVNDFAVLHYHLKNDKSGKAVMCKLSTGEMI